MMDTLPPNKKTAPTGGLLVPAFRRVLPVPRPPRPLRFVARPPTALRSLHNTLAMRTQRTLLLLLCSATLFTACQRDEVVSPSNSSTTGADDNGGHGGANDDTGPDDHGNG